MSDEKFSEIMSGKSTRARSNVSAEEFVRAWQSSKNVAEVSEKLGIPKHYCMAKASSYRALGVRLKMMARGPGKLDVAALNELISEAGGEKAAALVEADDQAVLEAAKKVTPEAEKAAETKKSKLHIKRTRSIV